MNFDGFWIWQRYGTKLAISKIKYDGESLEHHENRIAKHPCTLKLFSIETVHKWTHRYHWSTRIQNFNEFLPDANLKSNETSGKKSSVSFATQTIFVTLFQRYKPSFVVSII